MVYFLLSFCVAIEMVPSVMFFRYGYSSASLDVCIQIRHKPVIASHLQILWVFTVFNHDTSFRLLLKSHLYIQDLSLGTRFPNSISIFRLFFFFFFFFAYCNQYARYSTFSSFNFLLVCLSFFKSSPVHARVLFTDKDPVKFFSLIKFYGQILIRRHESSLGIQLKKLSAIDHYCFMPFKRQFTPLLKI